MSKKETDDVKVANEPIDNEVEEKVTAENDSAEAQSKGDKKNTSEDSQKPEKTPLEKAEESIANLSDRLIRTAAEFDNYKKRSAKEKDEIYGNAVCDTIAKLLPVLDNLERAVLSGEENIDAQPRGVLDGIKMVKKQFEEVLDDIGIKKIDAVGEQFDPEKHNAVMTAESEESENTVLEEFMRGYTYNDKVVRHSMVKVSN